MSVRTPGVLIRRWRGSDHRRGATAVRVTGLVAVLGLVLVLVAVSVAGCGSGPAPQAWAGQVCDALTPWRARIADLNSQAQQRMSSASTPEQTRAGLLELLAGGQEASEGARIKVVAAGTPDVDNGAEIASRFATSLAQSRDAYAHARTDLQGLSTADPSAFYDGVATILGTLNTEYSRSGVDTTDLNSVELREAFDKVDRCQ